MSMEQRNKRPFAVTIRFSVNPSDQEELMEMVTMMLMEIGPFLASQQGFLEFRCHRSVDGGSVLNHLLWESREDHDRCMASPEMEAAGDALMEWVESGRATLSSEEWELFSTIRKPE